MNVVSRYTDSMLIFHTDGFAVKRALTRQDMINKPPGVTLAVAREERW